MVEQKKSIAQLREDVNTMRANELFNGGDSRGYAHDNVPLRLEGIDFPVSPATLVDAAQQWAVSSGEDIQAALEAIKRVEVGEEKAFAIIVENW